MVPAGQKTPAPAHKNDAYEEVLYGIIKGRNGARDILIFKLRFFDEMGPAEIVRALGGELTAGAVSSIINRAVLRIRPILASKYGMRVK